MEPLRGGFLINQVTDEMKAILAKANPDWSLADWGLRWIWDQPETGITLSGMSTMDQVTENLATAKSTRPMSDQEQAAIASVRSIFNERLRLNCTGCGYCLPCPFGVNIPKNILYYSTIILWIPTITEIGFSYPTATR